MRTPLLAAALALALAAPSRAAVFLIFDGSTGVFGNDLVTTSPFTDTIDLSSVPEGWLISATITSIFQTSSGNIDFTSVALNGTNFDIGSTGQNEFRYVSNVVATGGSNLFQISGISGGQASYSGTINVAPVAEPATWMMMIGGFALVAMALRRSWRRAGEVMRTA